MAQSAPHHAVVRYGTAVCAVAAATMATHLLSGLGDSGISPQFFAAVLLSAWIGGLGPGLLATFLSGIATGYLIMHPHSNSWALIRDDVLRVAVFSVVAVLASSLHAATRRAAQEANRARIAAESANAAKSRFLAMVSHELRTPLGPIVMVSEMLADDRSLPERLRKDMETIRRHVGLEIRLIEDLLDLTRLSSGKMRLHPELLDVRDPIQAAVDVCRSDAAERRIELALDLPEVECPVVGDRVRLQQVFWNLIRNAIKFSDEGGKVGIEMQGTMAEEKPEARSQKPEGSVGSASVDASALHSALSTQHFPLSPIQHSAFSIQHSSLNPEPRTLNPPLGTQHSFLVRVRDRGIGIAPGRLSAIFDAFEQADREVSDRFGGLGLGLAICQALVEAHGGSVSAASEGAGKGAIFTVVLPAADEASVKDAVSFPAPASTNIAKDRDNVATGTH